MIILLIAICIGFSAFFSGSETAFLSLGKVRFKRMEDSPHPASKKVIFLLSDPHKLLITILIGNTFVNIAASAMLATCFYGYFGERGVVISILAMTVLILVFGEVTPKMLAFSRAESFSFFAAAPLSFFERLFFPFRYVLDHISTGLLKAMGIEIRSEKPRVTEQEIRYLFSVGEKRGVVKEKEKDMIYNALKLNDLNAADIMTPRIDVMALDMTKPLNELTLKIKESKKSRLPVYIHDIDNIVGIVHAKDFLIDNAKPRKKMVRKAYFVPESIRVDDLLGNLQKKRIHMAVVTDEYGVTSGVVTIEDIIEEIVGEIADELDFEPARIRKIDRKTFEADGRVHINVINDEIGVGIKTDEVDTVGGFVILKLGRIPASGDS
ncbi:MAG: hemolysin family protein, partial [Candidatus Omnitrophica bacterium]|nr:hemolysin family protein [Candidatus Omnitrophota bacterium]